MKKLFLLYINIFSIFCVCCSNNLFDSLQNFLLYSNSTNVIRKDNFISIASKKNEDILSGEEKIFKQSVFYGGMKYELIDSLEVDDNTYYYGWGNSQKINSKKNCFYYLCSTPVVTTIPLGATSTDNLNSLLMQYERDFSLNLKDELSLEIGVGFGGFAEFGIQKSIEVSFGITCGFKIEVNYDFNTNINNFNLASMQLTKKTYSYLVISLFPFVRDCYRFFLDPQIIDYHCKGIKIDVIASFELSAFVSE